MEQQRSRGGVHHRPGVRTGLRSWRRDGLALIALFAVAAGACDRAEEVTRPLDLEVIEPAGPVNIIIENGNGHFFFLPPVDRPQSNGEFNPNLATDVEICEWNRAFAGDSDPLTDPCVSVLESFGTSEIAVQLNAEQYKVNWHIRRTSGIQLGQLYAIRVLASGVPLGSAEVVIGRNGRQARQFASSLGGGVIPLNRNQTLPIKYRIEYGLFCESDCVEVAVSNEDGGTVTNPGEDVGATFPPDFLPEGTEDVTVIVEEIELEPGEQCLGDIAVLTTSGRCIRFDTEPRLDDDFEEDVVVGICPDDSDVPTGVDPANFMIHRFDPANAGQGVDELPGAAAPFLDCSGFNISLLDGGPFSRFANAGWTALKRLIGPAPLSARDEGFGGVTSRFSYFQWALPIDIVAASPTSQTAAPGQSVADPTVQVLTAHNHGGAPQVPAPDQDVTFEFLDPAGTSLGTVTVQSDGTGYASVPWTLTSDLGTHTVVASAFNAADVVFTAEAALFADSYEVLSASWTSSTSPAGTANAWHRLDPSGIANAAVADGYVSLPSGTSSALLPAAIDGNNAAWFGAVGGSATTGNYMGAAATSQGSGSGGTSTAPQTGTFTSPAFSVPTGTGNVYLSFQTWWVIESVNPASFDVMTVSIKDANGQVTALGSLNPQSDPQGGAPATPLTSGGFDQPPVWTTVTVDVSAFAGQQVQLLFEFDTRDALYNGFRGWLVDDVQLTLAQSSAGAILSDRTAGASAGSGGGSNGLNPVPVKSVRQP
jgi:hypothetical protein